MSSLIKSLALLIAIVGLAVASYTGLVNGESSDNIPGSLSELGDFDSLDWVRVLRSECKAHDCEPDKAFELLKKLDKIYAALDDDAKINRNEQKIVEQFEINQIDGDQFCAEGNFGQLTELSNCYRRKFLKDYESIVTDYSKSVRMYLHERENNFAFLCRSHVLKNLNKRVADLDETDRRDMEQTLGNKLMLLKERDERLIFKGKMFSSESKSVSRKWMDILLEFLKERSGDKLSAKNCIKNYAMGNEVRDEFNRLFKEIVIDTCWRWRNAVLDAELFQERDRRQIEDCTEEQANWMKYAGVCRDITLHQTLLVESLYSKFKTDLFKFSSLKPAMNSA